jgi:hypothetical protein
MLEKLTGRKKTLAQQGYCADCETRTLVRIPEDSALAMINHVKCSTCSAEFNVGPVTAERITP